MTVSLVNKSDKRPKGQVFNQVQDMITKQVDQIDEEAQAKQRRERKLERSKSLAAAELFERLFRTKLDARGVVGPFDPIQKPLPAGAPDLSSPLLNKGSDTQPKIETLQEKLDLPLSVLESKAETQASVAWRKTFRSLKKKKPNMRKRLDPSLSILA